MTSLTSPPVNPLDDGSTTANSIIPYNIIDMLATIIGKLDGQSSELAVIRKTQIEQSSELCNILQDVSELTSRVSTLEEEMEKLKRD